MSGYRMHVDEPTESFWSTIVTFETKAFFQLGELSNVIEPLIKTGGSIVGS